MRRSRRCCKWVSRGLDSNPAAALVLICFADSTGHFSRPTCEKALNFLARLIVWEIKSGPTSGERKRDICAFKHILWRENE